MLNLFGLHAEAIEMYKQLLMLDKSTETLIRMSRDLAASGFLKHVFMGFDNKYRKKDEAVSYLKQAESADNLKGMLGKAYAEMGRHEDAIRVLSKEIDTRTATHLFRRCRAQSYGICRLFVVVIVKRRFKCTKKQ